MAQQRIPTEGVFLDYHLRAEDLAGRPKGDTFKAGQVLKMRVTKVEGQRKVVYGYVSFDGQSKLVTAEAEGTKPGNWSWPPEEK